MAESDGSTPSDPPGPSRQSTGSSRHCLHCNKIFQAVHNGHRCCSADCTKARQALNRQSTNSSSAPVNKASKPAKRKKDTESPEKADQNGVKKSKYDPISTFIAELPAATILSLSKTELVSRLTAALSLLENNLVDISHLESKVSQLSDDLDDQDNQIRRLNDEAVQMKVAFADSVFCLQRSSSPLDRSTLSVSGPSYASVARGNHTNSVLVAKCVNGSAPAEPLSVLTVEELLDTPNSGLIPSHVRYKNNKVFVTLDNEVAVAKAAAILNKKPEFHSHFETAGKLNVSFPVVALFVNVSDPAKLNAELEHRNALLRGQILSVKVIFTKPQTTEGHVKIFLKSRAVRDEILALRKASVFGTYYRIVPVDLNREVRRCFKCQHYGHIQRDCPATFATCGKCAERHRAMALTNLAIRLALNKSKRLIGTDPFSTKMFNLSQNSLSDPANFPNRLKCLQINLRHSSLASASLAQAILDFEIDIVLIQEPYAMSSFTPVVANVPPGFSAFHMLSEDHAYGSAILAMTNVARNLKASFNLNVANRPLVELDFVPGDTSFVDLTLAGDQVKILRWLFLAIPSLSDHPYIFFEISHSAFVKIQRKPAHLKLPSVLNINADIFSSNLAKSLSRLPSPAGMTTEASIEHNISSLVSVLSSCALSARIPKPRNTRVHSMPWWSPELCALRSKVRSLYKAWSNNKCTTTELPYRRSKAQYQRSLRAAKCRAWEKVRESATNGDVFGALADFTGKSKSIPLPNEIRVDGSLSSDPVVIAEACARHFFPDEPPSDLSHSAIEASAHAALCSSSAEATPLISDWEFEVAARSMNSKSAPGIDALPADLLLLSLPLIKPFLMAILNACLCL
ncbi:hypothetical protein DAPPUDRAFT_119650 [Daphnia pulex]|uniref:CCHC-type domain-containing protein n=1 Tax=Daphnia pulex TaxID=6669 RepID=E9HZ56_DAPPU|nr:hypothetical protein DAPPUDRAFT_119650 [Daphnia pulex]|eukprot:EFX62974.1 hypothetical protein DAPPUDRAFT_119650 [Daphnia pulex]